MWGTWSTVFCPSPWNSTYGRQGGPAETGKSPTASCSTPTLTRTNFTMSSAVRLAPFPLIRYSQILAAKMSYSIWIHSILVIGRGIHLSQYTSCFVFLTVDESMTEESQKRKLNNLDPIAQYCQNTNVCRRTQLLSYFGGVNTEANLCEENAEAICDNCKNRQCKQTIVF